jgi:hypothetical protein
LIKLNRRLTRYAGGCINPEGYGNKWVRTTDVLLKRETLNHPSSVSFLEYL